MTVPSVRKRTGRPSGISNKNTITALVAALELGVTVDAAVQLAGISRSAYFTWMRRGAPARQRYESDLKVADEEQPFLDFLDKIEGALFTAERNAVEAIQNASIGGSWRAAAWFLERRFPSRWATWRAGSIDPEELAITVPPENHRDDDKLLDEIDRLSERLRGMPDRIHPRETAEEKRFPTNGNDPPKPPDINWAGVS